MRALNSIDLKMALDDLFKSRKAALESSQAGRLYGPMLEKRRDALAAVSLLEAKRSAPLAEQLAAIDLQHDTYGAAAFQLFEAYKRFLGDPSQVATYELGQLAEQLQAIFIPSLNVLRASYLDEAQNALSRGAKLAEHWASLSRFPADGGRHVGDWLKLHFESGAALADTLSARASARGEQVGRSSATGLRTEVLGLLSRFRQALADEVLEDQALPRDLEARVFSYFDELSSIRGAQAFQTVYVDEEEAPPQALDTAPTPPAI